MCGGECLCVGVCVRVGVLFSRLFLVLVLDGGWMTRLPVFSRGVYTTGTRSIPLP